jgi:hypothetical protein
LWPWRSGVQVPSLTPINPAVYGLRPSPYTAAPHRPSSSTRQSSGLLIHWFRVRIPGGARSLPAPLRPESRLWSRIGHGRSAIARGAQGVEYNTTSSRYRVPQPPHDELRVLAAGDHTVARKRLLAAHPWCAYCGGPATVADHQPPISLHHHQTGTDCCTLIPSCARCS